MVIAALIFILVHVVAVISYLIFTFNDYWSPKNGIDLRLDAEVSFVETGEFITKEKTIVNSSDGFKFVAFKSVTVSKERIHTLSVRPRYRYTDLVTEKIKEDAVSKAVQIHDAFIAAKTGDIIDRTGWKCINCGTVNSDLVTKFIKCEQIRLPHHKDQIVTTHVAI